MRGLRLALLPVLALLPAPVLAQPAPDPSAEAPVACGARAARYAASKGLSLWVARRGTMTFENPLRPLSPEVLQVLQVTIRNKPATAYGPDLDSLRRGASPAALEAQYGAPVKWSGELEGLPASLRILADDGAAVLAQLRFEACGDAPKVAEPRKPAPPRKPPPKPKEGAPAEATRTPSGRALPQGALPEGALAPGPRP
ncbi:hypothetical protein [uncultured Methylobacterium sp.]|jgi:hypothetical protein|uniref:hypothetical protein n=1 Tax=uncultured Methylobacterium sp. TaxID=157278 RepID=UPI00262503CB|nr:hypothetical protein [uncultured Methylobacterium sp.]